MKFLQRKKKQTASASMEISSPIPNQAVELGSINYANLSDDGRHGKFDKAVEIAKTTGKPIFANFVEWSG
jgi:hypothetical protein